MNMLLAMKYDDAVSAGELADIAGLARSTAREHLLKLMNGGLVTEQAIGRWRYYSLADSAIAEILEGFEALASKISQNQTAPLTTDVGMLHARCCGDHLSGQVGARLAERFVSSGLIRQSPDGVELSDAGTAKLDWLDVRAEELRCRPRRFLYLCPDWTEDSFHLGGAVGAALLNSFISRDWMRVDRKSRRVQVTPIGYAGLRKEFGLELRPPA